MNKHFLKFKKVCAALLMLAVAVSMSSCDDDPMETKSVAPDGTLEIYFWGIAIGTSGDSYTPQAVQNLNASTNPTPRVAVPGVVIKLEDGQTFTSDASGKMTITLPRGNYRYRLEQPATWSRDWDSDPNSSYTSFTYKLEDGRKYIGDHDWDILEVEAPGRFVEISGPWFRL